MANESKKILIVDDEPDIRNFLSACIEDAGFRVETAKDGIEAMEKVQADPPDLITLDLVMPRQSGVRVMRKLQENPAWANIPVIIITAHARDEFGSDDIKALSAFAPRMRPRYTIEKPVTQEKIVQAICDILKIKEQPHVSDAPPHEKNKIAEMIRNADPATLNQIRSLLNTSKATD